MSITPSVEFIPSPTGGSIKLKREICGFTADRIKAALPNIFALNAAYKSQADAADALGVQIGTLRNYIELTGIKWYNLKAYRPRRRNARTARKS